jgi:magnesium-transporting ATPase (P-type)
VSDLVVGDIIMIEAGMKVPADCIIISGMDITADEKLYHQQDEDFSEAISYIVKKNLSTGENHRENPDCFLLS